MDDKKPLELVDQIYPDEISIKGEDKIYIKPNWKSLIAKKLQLLSVYVPSPSDFHVEADKFKLPLESIDVSENYITKFWAGRLPELKNLNLSHNQLYDLDLTANHKLIKANVSHNKISELIIYDEERMAESRVESLDCSHNTISTFTLSPQILDLNISSNSLKNILPLANTSLQKLDASQNQLSELNLAQFPALKYLDCSHNLLFHSLNFQENNKLEILKVQHNHLDTFKFPFANILEHLDISANDIQEFYLPNQKKLSSLNVSANKIDELDASIHESLTFLDCAFNQIDLLFLPDNLISLRCNNNLISQLDGSKLSQLKTLDCSVNNLTKLTLNSPQLTTLDVSNNQLFELNTHSLKSLEHLRCNTNLFQFLDLTKNTQLQSLTCYNCSSLKKIFLHPDVQDKITITADSQTKIIYQTTPPTSEQLNFVFERDLTVYQTPSENQPEATPSTSSTLTPETTDN